MARQFLMTWNRKSQRWFKKANGKQFAVSCKVLAATYPQLFQSASEQGSYRAANQWWIENHGHNGQPPQGWVRASDAHNRWDLAEQVAELKAQLSSILTNTPIENDVEARAKIHNLLNTSTAAGETVAECAKQFLAFKRGNVGNGLSEAWYDTTRRFINNFTAFVGDIGINNVNGATLTKYRSHLMAKVQAKTMSDGHAKNDLQMVKQFVWWCNENDLLITLPKNIKSRSLAITIVDKDVEVFEVEEIKELLGKMRDDTKLFACLCLNCGFTQKDLSDLTLKEIDMEKGVITRKRSKTKKFKRCPVVERKLWKETLRLLRQQINQDTDPHARALTRKDGRELLRRELKNGDKISISDTVGQAWECLGARLTIKHLRKTSADLLAQNGEYQSVTQLFLGHAPTTIMERHYVRPAKVILAEGVKWLGSVYGLD